jgi:hypothetical protein
MTIVALARFSGLWGFSKAIYRLDWFCLDLIGSG